MVRTTIYFGEGELVELKSLSARQKRSQSEIIRTAVERYVKSENKKAKSRKILGAGAYSSGRSDGSENAEAILREGLKRDEGW